VRVLKLRWWGTKREARAFLRNSARLGICYSALFTLSLVLLSTAGLRAFAVGSGPSSSIAGHVIVPHFTHSAPPRIHDAVRATAKYTRGVDIREQQTATPSSRSHTRNSAFDRLIKPQLDERAKQQLSASHTAPVASQASSPSANFGGFLAAPSYQAIPYPNPGNSNSVVVTLTGDFNKDGAPDIATLDFNGSVNVLLNDGKGHFATPIENKGAVTANGGSATHFIGAAMADVDGDGYPDIVAKQWKFQNLFVFHNNHDGTFAVPTILTTTPSTKFPPTQGSTQMNVGSFVIGDVNGDGIADIVSLESGYDVNANVSTITIQTFLGKGQGTFDSGNTQSTLSYAGYNLGLTNNGALLQMLNGKLNLVFEGQAYDDANTGLLAGCSVIALISNGDGTFQSAPSTEVDFGASYGEITDYTGGLSLVDLNGDGNPDITLNFDDDYIYTALGKSDGTFGDPQVADSGFAVVPSGWAVVDVNGDGYPDFIDYDTYYTAIWPGKGDGTFANPTIVYSTGSSSTPAAQNLPGSNLVVADFDKDGQIDFAVVDGGSVAYDRASIFIGRGDGSFRAAPAVAPVNDPNTFPQALESRVALDLNGDGKTDVLLQDFMGSGPFPYLAAISDGKGNFTYKQALPGNPGGMNVNSIATVTGDFNGDGLQDVVFAAETGSYPNYSQFIAVAFSNGDGILKTPVPLNMGTTAFTYPFSGISIGDVNNDGKLDIVATYDGFRGSAPGFVVALGNGDGTFQPAIYTAYGVGTYTSALADLNGDGKVDLLISDAGSNKGPATVSVIYGDGTGTFNPANAQVVQTGAVVIQILVGDLNGDKKPDLVLLSEGQRSGNSILSQGEGALVYLNNGNGGFTAGDVYEQGHNPAAGLLADFNNDGIPDLYFSEYPATDATPTYYGSQLLLGNGDGTFGTPYDVQIPPAASILTPGDFLQDGSLDLVANSEYGAVVMLLNQGGTAISLAPSSSTTTAGTNEVISALIQSVLPHQTVPTGTLTFTENGTAVGTTDVIDGQATFSTSLPVGSHTIATAYTGDANFNPNSNAGSVQFTVVAPPVIAPSFSMQASATTLSITRGQSGSVNLTLVANSTYSGTVSFLISGPLNGLNAAVNPTSVTLAPGQTATASVAINTTTTSASSKNPLPQWMRATGGLSLACVFGLAWPIRRKKLPRAFLGIALLLGSMGLISGLSGCGGSSSHTAPKGQSTLVVTATPSTTGAPVQAATITVTVN
jgi:Bacterial Ig-like domain (group 3)/FG-GAP-like repeat